MYLSARQFQGDLFARNFAKVTNRTVRRRTLRIFGQDIRHLMRKSIKVSRPRPDGTFATVSKPGEPPRVRLSKRNGMTKDTSAFAGKKSMIYVYDEQSESVVVGPRKWNSRSTPTPAVLEFGGMTEYDPIRLTRYRHRKIGDGGEIRVAGAAGRGDNGRSLSSRNGMKPIKNTNIGTAWVAYGKIRTAAQARRANDIQATLFLKGRAVAMTASRPQRRRASVAARPYVRPALAAFRASGKAQAILDRVLASHIAKQAGRNMRRKR